MSGGMRGIVSLATALALPLLLADGTAFPRRTEIVLITMVVILTSSFTLSLFALLENSRLQAKMLAESAAPALMFHDAKSAQELLQPLRNLPQVEEATLYGADRRAFASYRREAGVARPDAPTSATEHMAVNARRIEVKRQPLPSTPGFSI